MEYLKSHGSFADLPLEMLLASWKRQYGEHRVQLWMDAFTSMQAETIGEPLDV